jgi:virulence factor Mce-like protein
MVVLLIVTWFAFSKDIPFTSGYRVTGTFSASTQLRVGDPVRVAGIEIGKVKTISPGPGDTQAVELELVRPDIQIHQDTTMRVRPRLLLEGSYYLELEPGSPSAPLLASRGVIPLSQTSTSVKADQIFGAFRRPSRESLKNVLHEFAIGLDHGGGKALGDASAQIAPALKYAAEVSGALQGTEPHDLSRLIAGAAATTSAFAQTHEQLADLVTQLNRTTGALASQDGALAASIGEFDGLMRETPATLDSFDRAAPPIVRFTDQVRPALRAARPVLGPADDLLEQARGLVRPGELPELIDLARPTLKELPRLTDRLDPLFSLVGPVTSCIGNRVVPLLRDEAPDGHLSTGRPIWQDLVHGLVGLASSTSSFDSNGSFLRTIGLAEERSVSLGSLPNVGDVVAALPDSPIGARPLWLGPGVDPPFRPDAKCADQDPVDLSSRDGMASINPIGATSSNSASTAGQPKASLGRVKDAIKDLTPKIVGGGR